MSKFAVIIPTFNRVALTKRAVESVLAQTYQNYELVVVDDGSTENGEALRCYVEASGGAFFRIEQQRGVAHARNRGVRSSSAPWLAFLDSDDSWHPDKLALQAEHIAECTECVLCHTEERWFRNGRFVNPKKVHAKASGECFERSLELCCISPSSAAVKRAVFDEVGGFDERFVVCEDYDLWLRLVSRYEVHLLSQPLVDKYGGHPDQLSQSLPAMDRFRVLAILKLLSRGLGAPQTDLALAELRVKLNRILGGAVKRGNLRFQLVYSAVLARLPALCNGSELGKNGTETAGLLAELVSTELSGADLSETSPLL